MTCRIRITKCRNTDGKVSLYTDKTSCSIASIDSVIVRWSMLNKLTLSEIPVGKIHVVLKLVTECRRIKVILCLIRTFQQC
jgi:hypothetical protein